MLARLPMVVLEGITPGSEASLRLIPGSYVFDGPKVYTLGVNNRSINKRFLDTPGYRWFVGRY